MLNLKAYFDESGTDAASKVVVVGGYIGAADTWRQLEEDWRRALKFENAQYYHATDAESRRPRGPYRGWGIKKARRLTDRMVSILSSQKGLEGVAVHVTKEDWLAAAELVKPHMLPEELSKFPNAPHELPFQILARTCIGQVLQSMNPNLSPEETISFVFERNDFMEAALEGYDRIRQKHPKRVRLGTLTFEDKKDSPALQAADLLAWQYRRVCVLRLGYAKGDTHRSLHKLVRPTFIFGSLGREELCRQVSASVARVLARLGHNLGPDGEPVSLRK